MKERFEHIVISWFLCLGTHLPFLYYFLTYIDSLQCTIQCLIGNWDSAYIHCRCLLATEFAGLDCWPYQMTHIHQHLLVAMGGL